VSVIAGTILEQSKKPLALWFRAIFEVTASMTRTIEKYRSTIIYETDDAPRIFGTVEEVERDIARLLNEQGYNIHRLEKSYPEIQLYVAHFLARPR
jgi:hypothetical protein